MTVKEKAWYTSPLGVFELAASSKGICTVQRVDKAGSISIPPSSLLLSAIAQMQEYFQGQRKNFDLPIDLGEASPFYQSVWQELMKIPYGRTTSYAAIAQRLGDANKMRAVGQANRANPLAIVIPCHRVIAKNGNLQGYFYGLEMKRKLLALENPMSFADQGELF